MQLAVPYMHWCLPLQPPNLMQSQLLTDTRKDGGALTTRGGVRHNILGHVRVVRSGLRSEAWPMAMQADMDILVMTPQCTSRLDLIEASL